MASKSERISDHVDYLRRALGAKGTAKRVILHAHRNATTGVLSLMLALSRELNRDPHTLSLVGIPATRTFLDSEEGAVVAAHEGVDLIREVPNLPGSLGFLTFILSNPVRDWAAQIRALAPDKHVIVHSHSAWLTGCYLPFDPGVRAVATFHGIAAEPRFRRRPDVRWFHTALAYRLGRAKEDDVALTTVSTQGASIAQELLGLSARRFQVIPNGLDRADTVMREASPPWRIDGSDQFTLGFVGQLTPGKGWRLAVDATKTLNLGSKRFTLVIAGTGEGEEEAARVAQESGGTVHYLGHVPDAGSKVIPFLDALALPSDTEGLPMCILEAMRVGTPVLATAVGAIPDLIDDGASGFIIERTPESLVHAVSALSVSPELAASVAKQSQDIFNARFTIHSIANQYSKIYEGLARASN